MWHWLMLLHDFSSNAHGGDYLPKRELFSWNVHLCQFPVVADVQFLILHLSLLKSMPVSFKS